MTKSRTAGAVVEFLVVAALLRVSFLSVAVVRACELQIWRASTADSLDRPTASDPLLVQSIRRLDREWEFEFTGKSYWIGYTADMKAIAEHGERAIEPLLAFFPRAESLSGRVGVVYTLHLIGTRDGKRGRFQEEFTNRAARSALLRLLPEDETRLLVLSLLRRDPWPADLETLFLWMKRSPQERWAIVKLLQRYEVEARPVHQAIAKDARLIVSARAGFASALEAYEELVARRRADFPERFDHEPGYFHAEALEQLTRCEYMSFGEPVEYFLEPLAPGALDTRAAVICSIEEAASRWLEWYEKHGTHLSVGSPSQLCAAAFSGGAQRLTAFLEHRPDAIRMRTESGATLLHFAARGRQVESVRCLLSRGADPNAGDSTGETALHEAAAGGDPAVIEALIENGARVDEKNISGAAAVDVALQQGKIEAVRLLVQREAALSVFVVSALGLADRLSAQLRTSPASVIAVDAEGRTALHYAASFGHHGVCRVLRDAGADHVAKDSVGRTPLHAAAANGHLRVLEVLAADRQRLDTVDLDERSALSLAAEAGHSAVVSFLAKAGANIDSQDYRGRTALAWAAIEGRREAVTTLLELGADRRIPDRDGYTPELWAEERQHPEVKRLLHGREE